jgi:nitric oxide dioxygenase
MDSNQKELIKATVPILKTNGNDLVNHFYNRLLSNHEELKSVFNMGNQASGTQQKALTGAILAYAENIENPIVLINVLKSIGTKHVSLNITPEQYDVVGFHLIESIKEVLGDIATKEIVDAWAIAYSELAAIMIGIEAEMYETNLKQKGGWNGWRPFIISKIIEETDNIKILHLSPSDSNLITPTFTGQYITIKTHIPELGYDQPMQYNLATSEDEKYYIITVKREMLFNSIISTALFNKIEGETVQLSAPTGLSTTIKNYLSKTINQSKNENNANKGENTETKVEETKVEETKIEEKKEKVEEIILTNKTSTPTPSAPNRFVKFFQSLFN